MNIYYVLVIIPIVYCVFILRFYFAWKKYPFRKINPQKENLPFISVIIPFRNEKDNLPKLLECINNQTYPIEKFEIITVDDHSSDGTSLLIKNSGEYSNVKIVKNVGEGKKNALKTGVLNSNGQLIITTDADCIPCTFWIESVVNNFSVNSPSMLQGPVKMESTNSFLSRFQSIDYMSLQMCGVGAIFLNQPVYCSSANLAFNKSDWTDAINYVSGKNYLSGDDVFLLHTFKKQKKKIIFIKDKDCCVTTKTEKNISGFINQRMRWGGKSLSYKDLPTIMLTSTVFLCNLLLSVAFVTFFFFPNYYFPIIFGLKIVVDYLLLKEGAKFYNIKMPVYEYIAFSIIYPFYLTITAFGSLFANVSWKGRKTKR